MLGTYRQRRRRKKLSLPAFATCLCAFLLCLPCLPRHLSALLTLCLLLSYACLPGILLCSGLLCKHAHAFFLLFPSCYLYSLGSRHLPTGRRPLTPCLHTIIGRTFCTYFCIYWEAHIKPHHILPLHAEKLKLKTFIKQKHSLIHSETEFILHSFFFHLTFIQRTCCNAYLPLVRAFPYHSSHLLFILPHLHLAIHIACLPFITPALERKKKNLPRSCLPAYIQHPIPSFILLVPATSGRIDYRSRRGCRRARLVVVLTGGRCCALVETCCVRYTTFHGFPIDV